MLIHVDFPSHAVLSVCAEGSGPGWNCMTQSQGSHVCRAFHRAWSWKAETWRKLQKVEPWKRLSSSRQLISPFSLWFHITFLLCFEHCENIIQIMLLETKKKKNLIITPSNEKMDTSEKCKGIVIFHILIHITRNRKETHAVYQIGLVPFAPSHAVHTDISFKYRLPAITKQRSPCRPHGLRCGVPRVAGWPGQLQSKSSNKCTSLGSVDCKLLLIPTNEICSRWSIKHIICVFQSITSKWKLRRHQ